MHALYCPSPGYSVGCRMEFFPKGLNSESQCFQRREDLLCLPWGVCRALFYLRTVWTLLPINWPVSPASILVWRKAAESCQGSWVKQSPVWSHDFDFLLFPFAALCSWKLLWQPCDFCPFLPACSPPGTGARRGRGDILWTLDQYGQNCPWRPEEKVLTRSQKTGARHGGSRENAKTKIGT